MKIPSLQPGFNLSVQAGCSAAVAPKRSDNAYADYVLDIGKRIPLSSADLGNLHQSVIRAVHDSRSRLIDHHTADMIVNTVLDALSRSQTFRDAVSYGIHNKEVHLGCIKYRNEYELNEESPVEVDGIQLLTCAELYEYDVGQEPVFSVCEAGVHEHVEPYISFSVAPDTESYEMLQSWQEGLIHEIIHHVTGASDPSRDSHINLGPTEILARRVAQDLGWRIPDFTGYAQPEREDHLRARNLNALRQAATRHEDDEEAFFERLSMISDGYGASPDFTEYTVMSDIVPGQIQQHDFPGLSIDDNLQDANQIQLYHGAPYIFTFGGTGQEGMIPGDADAERTLVSSVEEYAGPNPSGKKEQGGTIRPQWDKISKKTEKEPQRLMSIHLAEEARVSAEREVLEAAEQEELPYSYFYGRGTIVYDEEHDESEYIPNRQWRGAKIFKDPLPR